MSLFREPPKLIHDIATLLADGYDGNRVVAFGPDGPVCWSAYRELIALRRDMLAARSGNRVLLDESSPLEFSVGLLAAIDARCVPVIPPNHQPGTLDYLRTLIAIKSPPRVDTVELYTSGSSGEPKCVVKNLASLEAECRAQEAMWGRIPGDVAVVASVPIQHIYGLLFRILWPLLSGRAFDISSPTDPSELMRRFTVCRKALLVSSPAHLARLPQLMDLMTFNPKPMLIFSSGAPLESSVANVFKECWDEAPIEIYGSTESGGIAWRQQKDSDTAWTPIPGVAVSSDEDGALLIRSPWLSNENSLRMEDAVHIFEDGRFSLGGRLDRIAKIEGKRLSLPEMETRLTVHRWVRAAAVLPIPTANGRRTIIGAVIVLSTAGIKEYAGSRTKVIAELSAHLTQVYEPILVPRRWRAVECLPTNDRGKVSTAELVAIFRRTPK